MLRSASITHAAYAACAALLLTGCAARQPLARTTATVQLDKTAYRTLVDRAGTSSVEVSVVGGAAFASGGRRAYGGGVGISFQLTTEVRLVGVDADNLDRESFSASLRWGANEVELPLHHARVQVLLAGTGPGGRIVRQVGTLSADALAPGGYRLDITHADAPLTLTPR
jgi:hypothetical protein